jgi:PAS domain S-box-containing protein
MESHGGADNYAEGEDPARGDARRLLENATSHAIFELDTDGRIRSWPAPATALYGYEREAVIGTHVSRLSANESEQQDQPATFPEEGLTNTTSLESWHERADGSVFWATMSLSRFSEGDSTGYVAICRDTTAEKEHTRMLERQNDRLKEFTDILAHDLRNPLAVIDGNLKLYEDTGDESHIEKIGETTDRMARLVDDLLRVAKQGDVVTDPEPTLVQEVVETAWEAVGTGTDATLRCEAVRPVSGDPDRLCELFENLFRNAVAHGGEDVTVRVGPLPTGFFVADDGPGIPADIRDDVFDHGFTTSSEGSGYGLSVVRTIVNAHGWDVVVTDAASGGARFEITGIEFLE